MAVTSSCWVDPAAAEMLEGCTEIPDRVAVVIVSVAVLLVTEPDCAVIVVEPLVCAVASPVVLIVASVVLFDVQLTVLLKSWVEPSERVPVAVYCWVVPLASEAEVGVIASELSVAALTVNCTLLDNVLPEAV